MAGACARCSGSVGKGFWPGRRFPPFNYVGRRGAAGPSGACDRCAPTSAPEQARAQQVASACADLSEHQQSTPLLGGELSVADAWHPPVLTLFVPDGVALEATATSRTALR